MALSKWVPTRDGRQLRRLGKLAEELGELQAVAARCIIQGIDEVDPSSGRVNRARLQDELADVLAQCSVTMATFGLDKAYIDARSFTKRAQMDEWERLVAEDANASA